MADSTEEPRDVEEGGGPVKSFLEHLEDFRWLLVKTSAALGISFIVCLYAIPQIVWVLKWPLTRAALVRAAADERRTVVRLGTNTVGTLQLETNRFGALDLGTNWFSVIQLEPVAFGSNIFLTVRAEPNPPTATMLKSATSLVYLDPSAPFLSSMQLAFYGGILLASPFIFFFGAQFVLPALKVKEKKYVLRAAFIGVGLFLSGVSFCYFFVMARALKFAEWWAIWMGVKVPEWRAETYFSFVTKFMLGMGLGFELPVVLLALVKIGLLNYQTLRGMWRYMIVINLVLGALLTTPEVYTQVVMAVVLYALYEISVWIAWYWERRDRQREAAGTD
ncbi:MAG: twin-arginine translocase subunit TatC [Verrucomicrobia bacterium]|nr:twin-arginine translocase subunit TatC [Verrucomicrobiota bacterium]